MYMLAVFVVVAMVWIVGAVMAGGTAGLVLMWDWGTLLLLFVIGISILVATGLRKDFGNAFRLTMGKKKQAGLAEWKRAKEAVELFTAALRYGGIFIAIMQFVAVSWVNAQTAEGAYAWWITLAIIGLSPLYAYAVNILLLPIKSRININIIEYMQRSEEGERSEAEDEK